ncbi:MAG: GHMP family kinase ATP-binding protein [bacterium]
MPNPISEIQILETAKALLESPQYRSPIEGSSAEVSFTPRRTLGMLALKIFKGIYGDSPEAIKPQIERYIRLIERFEEAYGEEPYALVRVPARINIIGEHIDYVQYFQTRVLPFASREHDMMAAIRPRMDDRVRVASTNERFPPGEFDLLKPYPQRNGGDRGWMEYLNEIGVPGANWENYVKGAALHFQHLHPGLEIKGMDFLVDSTIPIAGGASSSSALVVAAGAGMRLANGFDIDVNELAESSSKAEWYVGTRGGKMDHATMCFAEDSCALLISFEPFAVEKIPAPTRRYRWITFYTRPAEKGSRVMSEYNERSAASRYIAPKLIERILKSHTDLRERWERLLKSIEGGDAEDIERGTARVEEILSLLPAEASLSQIETEFPEVYREIENLYPALLRVKGPEGRIKVRDRVRHHLGEIVRVMRAARALREASEDPRREEEKMGEIGRLLNETHESLRDLYEISTNDLDEVVEIAQGVPGVLGARLMGGGFGGNILALVKEENAGELIERVEKDYYAPRGRRGRSEEAILISSPGCGLRIIGFKSEARREIARLSNDRRNWRRNETQILSLSLGLLGFQSVDEFAPVRPIRVVVGAAGKGTRTQASGLRVPKPLAMVGEKPSLLHVLDTILSLRLPMERPVVIVSPETEGDIREALRGYDVDYVLQREKLGTAHAVLQTESLLGDFEGDALVVWAIQPVIRAETLLKSLIVHQAVGESAMTFPTAIRKRPYAPLVRNEEGKIVDSLETYLEGLEVPEEGEDNLGAFWVRCEDLFPALRDAHRKNYDTKSGKYRTLKGELGFPNNMVRSLLSRGKLVLGLAMADPREALGIKVADDLRLAEEYISQLKSERES